MEYFTLYNILAVLFGGSFLGFLAWLRGKMDRGDLIFEVKSLSNEKLQVANKMLKDEMGRMKGKMDAYELAMQIERDSAEKWQRELMEALRTINDIRTNKSLGKEQE